MRVPHITLGHATGILDKFVGLNKEVAGELFDRAELKKAGQAQQEKGTAKLSALQAETKVETEKAKVKAADKAQKSAERSS